MKNETKNETKHSPLPWTVDAMGNIWSDVKVAIPAAGKDQAECYRDHKAGETEANADFIVRACNSHYELVRALEDMTRLYRGQLDREGCYRFGLFDRAIEAIAQAKGKL